jgi:hypothetical protein
MSEHEHEHEHLGRSVGARHEDLDDEESRRLAEKYFPEAEGEALDDRIRQGMAALEQRRAGAAGRSVGGELDAEPEQADAAENNDLPEVSGFDQNSSKTGMDDAAIRKELDTYPAEFVFRDRIASVEYVPETNTDKGKTVLGDHEKVSDFSGGDAPETHINPHETGHIHLYRGNDSPEQTRATLGQDVYRHLETEDYLEWQNLNRRATDSVCFDDSAGDYVLLEPEVPNEDFANSFSAYHNDPERLEELSPERYRYMRRLFGDA